MKKVPIQSQKTEHRRKRERVNGSTKLKLGSARLQMKKVRYDVDFFVKGRRILLLIFFKMQ